MWLGAALTLQLVVLNSLGLVATNWLAPCLQSTLLDLLAGRKTSGETTGTVLFAGTRPTQAFLRRYTGVLSVT